MRQWRETSRTSSMHRLRPWPGLEAHLLRCARPGESSRRRSTGKRQEHHPSWIGTKHNKMSHAMGQRVGLAGAGTGDDQEGGVAMLDRVALFWVKPGEVRRCCHAAFGESPIPPASTPFDFSANISLIAELSMDF